LAVSFTRSEETGFAFLALGLQRVGLSTSAARVAHAGASRGDLRIGASLASATRRGVEV